MLYRGLGRTVAMLVVGLLLAGAMLGLGASSALGDAFQFKDLTNCCTLAGSTGNTPFTGAGAATAVNDNGDVVGTAYGDDGIEHGYVLKNGQFTLLGYLPAQNGGSYSSRTPFSEANDINDNDFIVGISSDGQPSRDPFGGENGVSWQPFSGASPSTNPFDYGQLETDNITNCNGIPGQDDCYTDATNVNASNDVAGYGEFLENPDGNYCWCTFPWSVPGGNRALNASSGGDTPSSDMLVYDHQDTSYITSGINAAGQVVVSPNPSTPSNSNSSAIYPGDVSVPFNASIHEGVRHAINDSGWVVGTDTSTSPRIAKVDEAGTVVSLPPLSGDTTSSATAINNKGDIVGSSSGSDGCPRAVEWPHGNYNSPIDLNAQVPSADEHLLYAQAVSNNGVIVGQGGSCSSGSYTANQDPWEITPQQISVSDVTLSEPATGSTAPANFTVTLSAPSTSAVTVDYTTTDANATGFAQPKQGDYTTTSGTLTFAPGVTSASVPVTVNGTGFFGEKTFSLDLSNPVNAVISDGHGVATIVGPSPLQVSVAVTPGQVTVPETAAGPQPVTATVAVTVKNVGVNPVDDVSVPNQLTIGWHAPASGQKLPVHQTGAPAALDLGTVAPGASLPAAKYTVEVDGDGSLDVQALVTGALDGQTVKALGTTLFEPDSQLLVDTAKLGAVVHSQKNPSLIQAGTSFLVKLTLENRSYYRKLAVSPIYPSLSGNAAGGSVVPSTVSNTSTKPDGSLNEVQLSPAIELAPGETKDYLVVVRTGGANVLDPASKGGGTRAVVKFAAPTAFTVLDNEPTKLAADHVVLTPGSNEVDVSIDDSTPEQAPFTVGNVVWSVSKGVVWGLWRATWGTVRGILWDLPSMVVKGIYNLSSATIYYMDHMVELWTACDKDEACLNDLEETLFDKVESAYNDAPYLLGQNLVALKQGLDASLTEHFSALAREWKAGDWETALTEMTAEGTDGAANLALLAAPAILTRFPKAAAAYESLKAATYTKVGEGLSATVRALEPAKAAVLALSKTVKPGYWFKAEQMAKLFGVGAREDALLSALTKRLGISVVLRSRASEAIKFLEEGLAVMKPYWIKTKNVSWLDEKFLGYLPEEVGKVVIRKPLSVSEVEANLRSAGLGPDSVEWEEALARRKTRVKEYDGEFKQMQKWNKAGEVKGKWPWAENGVDPAVQADEYSTVKFRLNTKNGATIPEIFVKGEGWKFITGDIDLIAITKANGAALSDAEHVAILKQLAKVLGTQHPESATWINDGKFWFKAKRNYLTNEGECCLAQYGPDGRVRAVEFNEKLSDPESWTKLAYRIFWKGGYEAGPGG